MAMLFGSAAFSSYQRWRGGWAPVKVVDPRPSSGSRPDQSIDGVTAASLRRARHALAEDEPGRALEIAQEILAGYDGEPASPRAVHEALVIMGWAHLATGRLDQATDAINRARKIDEPDPALVGAVLLARGDGKQARKVLEQARAAGDDRKEVVGPLIQALLEGGDTARAAAIALDVVESLSDDDVRRMAQIAFEARAFTWAARLYEAIFRRDAHANDAYEAARAFSLAGEQDRALELLERAVAAGFSDRARAWSDAALEALRSSDHLGTVLPRP
jgi:tetratricopeptide (TPR) repeat protein